MTDKRYQFGLWLSISWVIGMVALLFVKSADVAAMTPNSWGDFFAGAFAPLAFLWLVLGYLQQGEELRLSTEALRLQAEELKNSVVQQRELVEVSRQQVESEREALLFERRLREDLSQPKFSVIGTGGTFRGDGVSTYSISVSNTGHDATSFSAKLSLLGGPWCEIMSYPLFAKGSLKTGAVTHPTPLADGDSRLVLNFADGLGRAIAATYTVARESDDPQANLVFKPVEI